MQNSLARGWKLYALVLATLAGSLTSCARSQVYGLDCERVQGHLFRCEKP